MECKQLLPFEFAEQTSPSIFLNSSLVAYQLKLVLIAGLRWNQNQVWSRRRCCCRCQASDWSRRRGGCRCQASDWSRRSGCCRCQAVIGLEGAVAVGVRL